jgi:hypothetical protein
MDPNTSGKNIDSFLVTVGGTNRQTAASIEQARAAIFGDTLTVNSITLGDASAITLALNALAGDGAGNIVIGDGVTLGGIRLMKDVGVPSQNFLAAQAFNPAGGPSYFLEIASIPLTADQVSLSLALALGIEVDVMLSSTANITELGICFIAPGQTPGLYAMYFVSTAPASRNDAYSFRSGGINIGLIDFVGEITQAQIAPGGDMMIATCPATPGNVTGVKFSSGDLQFDFVGPQPITLGVATEIKFGVWIKTSNANLAGSMGVKARWVYSFD